MFVQAIKFQAYRSHKHIAQRSKLASVQEFITSGQELKNYPESCISTAVIHLQRN